MTATTEAEEVCVGCGAQPSLEELVELKNGWSRIWVTNRPKNRIDYARFLLCDPCTRRFGRTLQGWRAKAEERRATEAKADMVAEGVR